MAHLEDAFGPAQVLESMRTERFHARERRQMVATEVARRFGQERLPAVACREQPRDAIERGAEVVARADFDRARVKRHADAELRALRPWLAVEGALGFER